MDDITPQYTPPTNEQDTRKKNLRNILLLGTAIVIVLIGIYFLYAFLTKGKTASVVDTFPSGGNVIESGISGDTIPSGVTKEGGTSTGTNIPKLIEIYKGPLAGYTLLPNGYMVRGFDREKGRLVEININTSISNIVSDQPIPQVHDALFLGGDYVILRSLDNRDTIKTRLYSINDQQGGDFPLVLGNPINLADDILELSASPDNKKVVLVIRDPMGANIDVLDVATQKLTRAATLPLSEWIPRITNTGTIFLSAKASRFAKSGTYRIEKGGLVMSVRSNTGQTTLISPEGDVAYSAANFGDQFTAELRPADMNSTADPTILSFSAIADKCAWANNGDTLYCGASDVVYPNTPDDWYKGITRSSDSLWEYSLTEHKEKFLVNPVNIKAAIDMVDILPTKEVIFIKNRSDEHLWMYRLDKTSTQGDMGTSTQTNEQL